MEKANITVTFGPAAGDPATLSKRSRLALTALYRHPVAHNLEWLDVIALFEALGTVEHKSNHEIVFAIGNEHHHMRKLQGKDLTTDDVMALRHMLKQAGWWPSAPVGATVEVLAEKQLATHGSGPAEMSALDRLDLLAVVDHHEARLYHLDIRSADIMDHVIRPYDPHHFLHHPAHTNKSCERGQRSPEDHQFYKQIAQSLVLGERIVLIGHGKGHSNAAQHVAASLVEHHVETSRRVVCKVVADISSLTQPQLLDIGRRALTV